MLRLPWFVASMILVAAAVRATGTSDHSRRYPVLPYSAPLNKPIKGTNENLDTSILFYLTENGINRIRDIANPIIEAELDNLTLPDQHMSAVGINLYLTDIKVHDFKLTDNVELSPPDRVIVHVTNIATYSTMNWRYHDGPAIDIRGDANDTLKDTTAEIVIQCGTDGEGHATLEVSSISVHVGSLDIVLHGGDSKFYEAIAKMFKGVMIKILEKEISTKVKDLINTEAATLIKLIPVQLPLVPGKLDVNYPLVIPDSQHGMKGTYYHNAIFGSKSEAITYSSFDIHLPNYKSIDVKGYFQPELWPEFPGKGDYTFQIHFTQRGKLEISTESGSILASVGSLEMHNPGMCWPQHHTDTTSKISVDATTVLGVRLRFQSGCGGGSIEINLCDGSGSNCQALPPMAMTTTSEIDIPVIVSSNYISVASNATFSSPLAPGVLCPLPHHDLPLFPTSSTPQMIAVIDEYLFNSGGFALRESGLFDIVVTQSMMPSSIPIQLNTTFFEQLLPSLYKEYPDKELNLIVFMPESDDAKYPPPSVVINPSQNVSVEMYLGLNISVLDAVQKGQNLIVAEIIAAVTGDGEIQLKGLDVTGEIATLAANLSCVWTSLPSFDVSGLDPLISFAVKVVLVPLLNVELSKGIPLPLPIQGVELMNTKIEYDAGFVTFFTDFNFVGPLPPL